MMKYNVGNLVFLKHCEHKTRPRFALSPRLRPRPRPRPRLASHPELYNSFGIVTQAIKNSDNIYVWFSQVDGKEYCFYEDEVTGEVVE